MEVDIVDALLLTDGLYFVVGGNYINLVKVLNNKEVLAAIRTALGELDEEY